MTGSVETAEGRGRANLQNPVPWKPPPPHLWIFAEINKGDRKQGIFFT